MFFSPGNIDLSWEILTYFDLIEVGMMQVFVSAHLHFTTIPSSSEFDICTPIFLNPFRKTYSIPDSLKMTTSLATAECLQQLLPIFMALNPI